MAKGPVLIELDDASVPPVSEAPPVPDVDLPAPTGLSLIHI